MTQSETLACLRAHIGRQWPNRLAEDLVWALSPGQPALPAPLVCRVRPANPSEAWVYATLGAHVVAVEGSTRHEFCPFPK